jgi:hypothetical protein
MCSDMPDQLAARRAFNPRTVATVSVRIPKENHIPELLFFFLSILKTDAELEAEVGHVTRRAAGAR